ncbi:MAG TPA: PAS domain S-box protein [Lentimicrobium sp.]|nr:PAS domain S-box protein [Lentimicrobium sp.]
MSLLPDLPSVHLNILNSINDAVIVRNLNGNMIFVNTAACKLFGFESDELVNRDFAILVPPSKVQEEKRLVENILWGENVSNYETERIDKHGSTLIISASISAFKDPEGKTIGITSVIRNITEEKKSEGKFQALLESAPDAMVITNRFGQIVLVNAQTEKLFGYERTELIGKEVEILIPMPYRGGHPEHRKTYMEEPRIREMGAGLELYALRKDKTEFPVEISLSPLHFEEGIFVSAAIRDISNQKKAALELRDYASKLEFTNRELEQFAYVASHDLQEPLRNITNYAQLLEDTVEETLSADAKYFLNVITTSTERMKVLINQLLSFSRIGRNREPQEVDCVQVLNEVITDIADRIKENNATIKGDDLPVVKANYIEIKQLFQNLIGNAIKFRKKEIDPVIIINSRELENEWEFSVSDNGIGIKEEYLNKIFLIFQRLHSQDEYPGTGIGLATCKKIVESNEGKIWVTSTPGEGTTFYFTLPKIN